MACETAHVTCTQLSREAGMMRQQQEQQLILQVAVVHASAQPGHHMTTRLCVYVCACCCPALCALQSAILGYGLFQGLGAAGLLSRHLNAAENVIVQTTAGEHCCCP